jgi:hypothetical protein
MLARADEEAAMTVLESGRLRPLLRALRQQGWTLGRTSKNHWRFISPQGDVVVASGTPRSAWAFQKLMGDLKRRGFRG